MGWVREDMQGLLGARRNLEPLVPSGASPRGPSLGDIL